MADYLNETHCSWHLDHNDVTAGVFHSSARVPVVSLELRRATSQWDVSLSIAEEHGRLLLWDFIGDPDYRDYGEWSR